MSRINPDSIENEVIALGRQLLADMQEQSQALLAGKLNLRHAEDSLMEWSMRDPDIKVDLFRFVDTLPALTSSSEVVEHIQEYFKESGKRTPLIRTGVRMASVPGLGPLVAHVARKQVKHIARRFIVGENPAAALPRLRSLRKSGITATIDLLGEAAVSEDEARVYLDRYKAVIQQLAAVDEQWRTKFPLPFQHPADKSIVNISIKPSSLYSQASPLDFERSVHAIHERLVELLRLTFSHGGTAYVDMEDSSFTDITLAVIERIITDAEFDQAEGFGIVLQAYLKRTEDDISRLLELQRHRSARLRVRLVKGAYWDTEVIHARLMDWPVPVFLEKNETDANYEKLSRVLIDAEESFYPAFASHNIRSIAHAICYAQHAGCERNRFEVQALYGMGNEFKRSLIARHILVRDYCPVGELLPGMAYLVRRLLENTANEGFLRQASYDGVNPDILLMNPALSAPHV